MLKVTRKKIFVWCVLMLMSIFVSGCDNGNPILGQAPTSTDPSVTALTTPTVIAIAPKNNVVNVSRNIRTITAEFSLPMDASTLPTASFTLSKGTPAVLETGGAVSYANKMAELTLATLPILDANTVYTATVSTAATSIDGVALASDYVWSFTTGLVADLTKPTVLSTSPRNGDLNISIKKIVTATFSKEMRPSSITATAPSTFTLIDTNTSLNVDGNVSYSVVNKISSFKPVANLTADTNYTAKITTVAEDLDGNTMLNDYNWTFATAAASVLVELVPLAQASTYGIAATAGVTNTLTTPNTQIDGNVVLNPLDQCNAVTVDNAGGFGLCGGAAPAINGTVVTITYPDTVTAQNITDDLRAAYLSITPANMPGGTSIAAGTTLGAPIGNALVEGDNLFYTGVYTSNTSILITGDLTIDAQDDPNATFVFQSASTVGTAPTARILLVNGAKASNIWWQAGSDATLQTNTTWNGNILAYRDVTMKTGTSSCGRLFAGAFTDGAFVFDSNRVSVTGNASSPVGCQ